jgi:hypothetical protein
MVTPGMTIERAPNQTSLPIRTSASSILCAVTGDPSLKRYVAEVTNTSGPNKQSFPTSMRPDEGPAQKWHRDPIRTLSPKEMRSA